MSIESRSRQYGKVFDHWQIKEFLGQGSGGKSAVFRLTRSDSTRGTSALKVINLMEERGSFEDLSSFRKSEYLAAREDCSNKAEQEVWLMDDLQGNTNIVDYLDHTFVDWSDEFGFGRDMLIRMELLKDLRGVIQKGHVFSEAEVLKVGKDICTALVLCHRKNILHRDIKPENIFVNKDGNFKLGDFGVSRILSAAPMAMASTGIGTPEYAAPEQFSGHHDKRVDIYSLGLVLYELGNQNRLPFAESTYARQEDIRRRHMGEPLPTPCNVGDDFAKVILKACAHRAEDRYQTAGEFLKALNRIAKRLVAERKTGIANENERLVMKADPTYTGFETQKATYDEYMTVPAQPNSEVPEFDWDAYSTMMAKAVESTEALLQQEPDVFQSEKRFKKSKNIHHRRFLPILVGLITAIALVVAGAMLQANSDTLMSRLGDAKNHLQKKYSESQEWLPTGKLHRHEWQSATCSNPKTCSICGVTEGKTLNHTMTGATYSIPARCTVCGKMQGAPLGHTISAGTFYTLGIKEDGSVQGAGNNLNGQLETAEWNDVVAVSAGTYHSVGLKSDGTVVACGGNINGQCNVEDWKDIVAVATSNTHTVGLRSNGTVVSVGYNAFGCCNTEDWTDIVAVATGHNYTVGLKSDGTVLAVGRNYYGQCDVSDWSDIISIVAGDFHTVGLKRDGTVVAVGQQDGGCCDTQKWKNIVAIDAGPRNTVGLESDGSVVVAGTNNTLGETRKWRDIVSISMGDYHLVGLKSDGTAVAVGSNYSKQCDVSDWKNMKLSISADPEIYRGR